MKNTKEWNMAQILLHLCRIVVELNSLWPRWVNGTALKHKKNWIMDVPTNCSWIWRRVLQLRTLAHQFLTFKIGNGHSFSVWFDPWWNSSCLASSKHDHIISQAASRHDSMIHDLIAFGEWVLLTLNQHIHHYSPGRRHGFLDLTFLILTLGNLI